jgi:hypothetical protein
MRRKLSGSVWNRSLKAWLREVVRVSRLRAKHKEESKALRERFLDRVGNAEAKYLKKTENKT